MAHPLLDESLRVVARLADRGECADAATVLALWQEIPLPPFEKSIVTYNLAQMRAALGQVAEALALFDQGIAIERPLKRCLLAEGKAALLAAQQRPDEAIAIWMEALASGFGDEAARARMQANLATLLGQR